MNLRKDSSNMLHILAFIIFTQHEPIKTTQHIPVISRPVEFQRKQIPKEVISIRRFFKRYNSILQNYSYEFYEISEAEGLDYRILPSIAMVESSGGKKTPICADFNPFGWSSSGSPCGFASFKDFGEAIKTVGRGISRNRAYDRYKQSKEITVLAEVYNPGGAKKWAQDIKYFITKFY